MMNNFDNQGLLVGTIMKMRQTTDSVYVALDSDSRPDHHCYHFVKVAPALAANLANVQLHQKVLLTVHLETKLTSDQQTLCVVTVADQVQLLN